MEIWGVTIGTQLLFFFFVVFIGIMMLVFFRNRKYNLLVIKAVGKELEQALKPNDQTYTWLGGSIGFTAEYQSAKPLRKAEATLTMLSRQSLLFYPISKLFFGNDRLFVVLYPVDKFRREAHVLEKWYYKIRLRQLDNESSLHRQEISLHGKTFYLLSSDKAGIKKLSAWMHTLSQPELVKHVAIMPEPGSFYLYMAPQLESVTPMVQALQQLVKSAGKEHSR